MYLIHEENHSDLCVAEDIWKGILWLIRNDWLDGKTVGIDENCNEFDLEELVPAAKENEYMIFGHLIKVFNDHGKDGVFEFLERFGIYFHEIEVA